MRKAITTLVLLTMLAAGKYAAAQTISRCGSSEYLQEQIAQHPELMKLRERQETITNEYVARHTLAQSKGTGAIYTIPVVVHVLHNPFNPATNISDAQVQSQIDALNRDYQLLNTDVAIVPPVFSGLKADCQVQFCLAKQDPLGKATTGITRKSTTKSIFYSLANDAKFIAQGGDSAWRTDQYLNIWVAPALTNGISGLLGYAQFPGGGLAATDGVVIDYKCFGTTGTATAPYNKGRTATHEIGHWLNLYHLWGPVLTNPNCTATDFVDDTPLQSGPNYNCPSFPHISCPLPTTSNPFTKLFNSLFVTNPGDMFMNYMDYPFDACLHMFTQGQKLRMQAVLAPGGFRASLANSKGCTPSVIYTIPVVVHILYVNPTNQTTDARVQSQIDVLNQDFRLLNADAANVPAAFAGLKADCQIEFCLAKRDPQGNATTGIIRKATTHSSFDIDRNDEKFSSLGGSDAWPSDQYLNIWVVPSRIGHAITAFDPPIRTPHGDNSAQFPGGPAATDGLVIANSYFGTVGNTYPEYSKGRGVTHLVGHWLNLEHLWGWAPGIEQDSNITCTVSDYVDDTPPQFTGNKSSNPGQAFVFPHISCNNGPNGDMFMNFMDMGIDASKLMFTHGQKARMRAVLAPGGFRASLANSNKCTPLLKPANTLNTKQPTAFILYPNPTRGEVNFEYYSKTATTATVSIIDQSGRTCKTLQLKLAAGQNKPVFNISDLSAGFYFVRMTANNETVTTKLFLER